MNRNPARPKEDCLGKACQQAEQGASHSADAIRQSPEPSKPVTAFSSHSASSAETTVCARASFFPKKGEVKRESDPAASCMDSGAVGQCGAAPAVESSHTPAQLGGTSRGMFHTLPRYLSWQQQATFRDLSPGTVASVSQLQFSRRAAVLLQLHTKEQITPAQGLEKAAQMHSHSSAAIPAGRQH